MATVHTRGNFSEALWPGLVAKTLSDYKEFDTRYTQFYTVKKSDKAFEKVQKFTGFPRAGIKEEGSNVPYASMYQGYQEEFRHYTYSAGAMVTREMAEDDLYGIINKIPSLLTRSMRATEETVATNRLNNAFSTSYAYADGKALCVTDHPLVATGGTAGNRPASDVDLSETALENMLIDVANMVDDQGLPMMAKVTKLVVPVELEIYARKILETKQAIGNNYNDKNIVSTYGIGLVASPYLTDTDAWFGITDVKDGLVFYRRRPMEVSKENDFDTESLKTKVTTRFATGVEEWRGVWGTQGA